MAHSNYVLSPVVALKRTLAFLASCLVISGVIAPKASAQFQNNPPNTVGYSPTAQGIQGTIPFGASYQLTLTAPTTLAGAVTVSFGNIQVTGAPAGVSNATATSYLTFSPSSVSFSTPGQTQTVTITLAVPANAVAGSYGYQLYTTGWTGTPDNFGTSINATVSPATSVGSPPLVAISTPTDLQVFSVAPSALPAQIPFSFTSTGTTAHPILSTDANVDGTAVSLTNSSATGNATVTSNGTLSIAQPGTYHVQGRATNDGGTSGATNTFTVVVLGVPPTVTINSPTLNQVFTALAGVIPVTPFSFNASSSYGAISAVTATLDGNPLTIVPVGLGSLGVSLSLTTLGITTFGSHTVTVTATNPYGTASTQTVFTVVDGSVTPKLTIGISKPINGSTVTRVAGSPATSVPFVISAAETNGTVSTLTATLTKGTTTTTVTFTPTGIGTGSAGGTGNLSVSSAGTYTLTAKATGTGSLTASTTSTFTVVETQPAPQPCTTKVLWLQPLADGKVQSCSNTVSVAFEIQKCCSATGGGGTVSSDDDDDDDDCSSWYGLGDKHNRYAPTQNDWSDHSSGDCTVNNTSCTLTKDTTVVVSVYEVFSNGTTGTPKTYSYTYGYVGSTHYAISTNNVYKFGFTSASGKHRYRIEVDNFQNGSSTPTLIGTREFLTQ